MRTSSALARLIVLRHRENILGHGGRSADSNRGFPAAIWLRDRRGREYASTQWSLDTTASVMATRVRVEKSRASASSSRAPWVRPDLSSTWVRVPAPTSLVIGMCWPLSPATSWLRNGPGNGPPRSVARRIVSPEGFRSARIELHWLPSIPRPCRARRGPQSLRSFGATQLNASRWTDKSTLSAGLALPWLSEILVIWQRTRGERAQIATRGHSAASAEYWLELGVLGPP
jgi:hypothetical protein